MNEQKRDALEAALLHERFENHSAPCPHGYITETCDRRIADALLPLVDTWLAEAWGEGYGDDITCNDPRTNPYREEI